MEMALLDLIVLLNIYNRTSVARIASPCAHLLVDIHKHRNLLHVKIICHTTYK